MKYIFGNWKMYLNATESVELAETLSSLSLPSGVTVAVFPTLLSFREVQATLASSSVAVGVQNVNWVPKGAYTGAVSAHLAKEAGARYSLIGHSERRYIFGEKDSDVGHKVQACEEARLTPVICIGETKEDVAENKRQYRLKKQMEAWLKQKDFSLPFLIAYEPVWAISNGGVGTPCSPTDAEDVIGFVKHELKNYTDVSVPVLYGGSVNERNCQDFLCCTSIDGVLVGSASTRFDSFITLLQASS